MDTETLLPWFGRFEVLHMNQDGECMKRSTITPNLITDSGLNLLRNALKGDITDIGIKYVALGNSDTTPQVDQVKLQSECFRKAVTEHITDPLTAGKLYTEVYIADSEANDSKIEEIGWFAGSEATNIKDSGVLIARVLYPYQKDDQTSLIIRRVDTFQRG